MRKLKTIAVASLFILSLFFIVFNVSQVHAVGSTYYVATTGNDVTGDGSIGTPWKTIWKGCNMSSNGDTLYIRGGTYTPTKQIIILNKNGAGWLTISNYPGEHVIINGSNCPTGYYLNSTIEIKNSAYIRLTGLNIEHSKLGGLAISTALTACNHIRFDNGSIRNCSSFGFKSASGSSNITLEYSTISNNHNNWSGVALSQEAISFSNTKDFYICHNTINKNHAEIMDIKTGSNWGWIHDNSINTTGTYVIKGGEGYWGGMGIYIDARGTLHNVSIYGNSFFGNNTGIELSTETAGHYENISIYNNIFNITNTTGSKPTDKGRYGIFLGNEVGSTQIFKDIKIYSNTIYCSLNNIYSSIKTSNDLTAARLKRLNITNNIFIKNNKTSGAFSYYMLYFGNIASTDGIITLNNNLYYNYFAGATFRIHWKDGDYDTSTPAKWGNNPLFVNPLLYSIATGDFHLNSTSPAVDAANSSLVPSTDYDGNPRPLGYGYDIGAYEYDDPFVINITSDVDFNINHGVRYGSGTAANPYVICNWTIYNVSISGTTKNVTIKNCTILHHVLLSGLSASSNLLFDTVTMDGAGHIPLSYIYLTHTLSTFTNSKFYNLSYSYMKNG